MALARALQENFNGEAAPHELANAMSISPTSSAWQSLTGASVAYGLTEGGYNAVTISLTPLGSRIVAPEEEGDDSIAIREAALLPRIMKQFFQKYDRGKFPQEAIGINVLASMGALRERVHNGPASRGDGHSNRPCVRVGTVRDACARGRVGPWWRRW